MGLNMVKDILKEISSSIIAFMIISTIWYIINPEVFLPYNEWDIITYKSIIFGYLYMPTVIAIVVYYAKKELKED